MGVFRRLSSLLLHPWTIPFRAEYPVAFRMKAALVLLVAVALSVPIPSLYRPHTAIPLHMAPSGYSQPDGSAWLPLLVASGPTVPSLILIERTIGLPDPPTIGPLQRRVILVEGYNAHRSSVLNGWEYATNTTGAVLSPQALLIDHVIPGSPADLAGLQAGDLVWGLEGHSRLTLPDSWPAGVRTLQRMSPDGTVDTLVLERDEGMDVGITVSYRAPAVLPDFTLDSGGILRGPSAGLLYALAYLDALDEGDLTGGRRVAASGEIAWFPSPSDGSSIWLVFNIGGVEHKLVSASRAAADLVLLPKGHEGVFDELIAELALDVVFVDTVDDALSYLCATGGTSRFCPVPVGAPEKAGAGAVTRPGGTVRMLAEDSPLHAAFDEVSASWVAALAETSIDEVMVRFDDELSRRVERVVGLEITSSFWVSSSSRVWLLESADGMQLKVTLDAASRSVGIGPPSTIETYRDGAQARSSR